VRVTCSQPTYCPWWGVGAMLQSVDLFVAFDDVQLEKHSYQQRCYIKSDKGKTPLIVPAHVSLSKQIHEIEIDNSQDWRTSHIKSIKQNYSKVRYGGTCDSLLQVIGAEHEKLADLNIEVTQELYRILGAKPIQWVRSSSLKVPNRGRAEHLITVLREVGATYYLANKNSTYLLNEVAAFEKAGIELEFADFVHEEYPQLYPPFIPGLSMIDLLMNLGPEKSLEHCQAGIFTRTPESRALCV
jgi:hypothetical protein